MADTACFLVIPRQAREQDSFETPSQVRGQARGQETRARTNLFPHLMRDHKEAGGIGHLQRVVRLYFRPKLVSVKRSDRSERPERLLFERSEFQTRQRTKGTK